MIKFVKNNGIQPIPKKPEDTPTLGEKLNAFVDKFDSPEDYPPAICNISLQRLRTRKLKVSQATIEEMPPHPKRQTPFHTAALYHDRKWMRFICQGAQDEDLLKADIYGKTPLHYAATRELLGEMIAQRKHIESLLEIPDAEGNTPLHLMALAQKFDASFLFKIETSKLKALLNLENGAGHTVLEIINNNGDTRLFHKLFLLCKESPHTNQK